MPRYDPWTNKRFGFPRKDAPAFQREWMPMSSSGVKIDNAAATTEQVIIKPTSSIAIVAQAGIGAIKIARLPAEEDKITITDAGGDTSGFWFTNLHATAATKSEGNMWVASATTTAGNVDNLLIAIAAASNLDTTAAEPTQTNELPASQRLLENSLTDWVILTQGTAGVAGNTTITSTGTNFKVYSFGEDGLQGGAPIRYNTGTVYLWGLAYCVPDSGANAGTIIDADGKEVLTVVATQNGPYFLQLSTPIQLTPNSGLSFKTITTSADSYCTPFYVNTTLNYEQS